MAYRDHPIHFTNMPTPPPPPLPTMATELPLQRKNILDPCLRKYFTLSQFSF